MPTPQQETACDPLVGCQTITFGDQAIQHSLPDVLDAVKSAGYDGVEIGVRHLDLNRPEKYVSLLKERGLRLTGIHVGGNYFDAGSVARERTAVDQVTRFLRELGSSYLLFSGAPGAWKHDAELLAKVGAKVREEGIHLCYHNHGWELENGAEILAALCEKTPPEAVSLALDIGWVHRAGASEAEILRRFASRIGLIHLKDVRDEQWAEVGHGDLPWAEIMPMISNLGLNWWVTEMDTTNRTPLESIALSRRYLKESWSV